MKGPNTEEEFQAIERLLSLERLSRYAELSDGHREKTIKLYQNNTALSEALYTPLQGLEVCLRNACSIELAILLGDTWHENTHAIFEHPVTEMIERARRSLTNDGKRVTLGRMVSELNFGFWVAILAPGMRIGFGGQRYARRFQIDLAKSNARKFINLSMHFGGCATVLLTTNRSYIAIFSTITSKF